MYLLYRDLSRDGDNLFLPNISNVLHPNAIQMRFSTLLFANLVGPSPVPRVVVMYLDVLMSVQ